MVLGARSMLSHLRCSCAPAIPARRFAGHECQRQAPARWPATLHRGGVPRVKTRPAAPAARQARSPIRRHMRMHDPLVRGERCPTIGPSRPARSTPARSRTPPPAPGPCRSTRPRPTSSRHRARGEPVRAQGVRQHLHPHLNPTQDAVEQRVAGLEGGVGALLLASGQAAETFAILNVAEAGDHVVASPSLYGGTYNLLKHTLPKFGIEVDLRRGPRRPGVVAGGGPAEHQAVLRRDDLQPQPGRAGHRGRRRRRPRGRRAADRRQHDGDALPDPSARVGRRHRGPLGHQVPRRPRHRDRRRHRRLAATSTSARTRKSSRASTPRTSLQRPGVRAATSASDGILGANLAYILKARVQLLRDLGSAVSPFNAFLIAQGLETLSLRIERHVANAVEVADWLEARDRSSRSPTPACRRASGSSAAASTAPGAPARWSPSKSPAASRPGKRFVDALELHSHVANIGDVRSLVIHPASTTHSQLTAEERRRRALPRAWCAWPWASRTSTTSWPTWSRVPRRKGRRRRGGRGAPAVRRGKS